MHARTKLPLHTFRTPQPPNFIFPPLKQTACVSGIVTLTRRGGATGGYIGIYTHSPPQKKKSDYLTNFYVVTGCFFSLWPRTNCCWFWNWNDKLKFIPPKWNSWLRPWLKSTNKSRAYYRLKAGKGCMIQVSELVSYLCARCTGIWLWGTCWYHRKDLRRVLFSRAQHTTAYLRTCPVSK